MAKKFMSKEAESLWRRIVRNSRVVNELEMLTYEGCLFCHLDPYKGEYLCMDLHCGVTCDFDWVMDGPYFRYPENEWREEHREFDWPEFKISLVRFLQLETLQEGEVIAMTSEAREEIRRLLCEADEDLPQLLEKVEKARTFFSE